MLLIIIVIIDFFPGLRTVQFQLLLVRQRMLVSTGYTKQRLVYTMKPFLIPWLPFLSIVSGTKGRIHSSTSVSWTASSWVGWWPCPPLGWKDHGLICTSPTLQWRRSPQWRREGPGQPLCPGVPLLPPEHRRCNPPGRRYSQWSSWAWTGGDTRTGRRSGTRNVHSIYIDHEQRNPHIHSYSCAPGRPSPPHTVTWGSHTHTPGPG